MKKINLYIFVAVLVLACSSSSDDDPIDPPAENQAPSKVETLIYPTNNLLCTNNSIEFEWSASNDPDGDKITYLLEVSQDNQFLSIDESHSVSTLSKIVTLKKAVVYYWRVKAIDSKGLESEYSVTNQFYTEGEGLVNHLPFSAELVAPELNASISENSIDLKWNSSDVDNDPLTYDVYLDTVNPPLNKVGENQDVNALSVNLESSTSYYWQVVVKDGNGGESIGQVWSFNTK